jgi:hypothetical protein
MNARFRCFVELYIREKTVFHSLSEAVDCVLSWTKNLNFNNPFERSRIYLNPCTMPDIRPMPIFRTKNDINRPFLPSYVRLGKGPKEKRTWKIST